MIKTRRFIADHDQNTEIHSKDCGSDELGQFIHRNISRHCLVARVMCVCVGCQAAQLTPNYQSKSGH